MTIKKNYFRFFMVIQLTLLALIIQIQLTASSPQTSLLYREDWTEIPAAIPVTQEHISHQDLKLNLYGSASENLKKSHHEELVDDPYYVWSGRCLTNWAATFSHRSFFVNLSGDAKIKWRSKQSGFRRLHILLKLSDGTWIVSEKSQGASKQWKISDFKLKEMKWYLLNIKTITEKRKLASVDLSQVDEVGFTDLMRGGLSPASSRLDWLEVYGNAVSRPKSY